MRARPAKPRRRCCRRGPAQDVASGDLEPRRDRRGQPVASRTPQLPDARRECEVSGRGARFDAVFGDRQSVAMEALSSCCAKHPELFGPSTRSAGSISSAKPAKPLPADGQALSPPQDALPRYERATRFPRGLLRTNLSSPCRHSLILPPPEAGAHAGSRPTSTGWTMPAWRRRIWAARPTMPAPLPGEERPETSGVRARTCGHRQAAGPSARAAGDEGEK